MLIKPLQHLDHVYKVLFNCEENENYFLYLLLTDTAHVTWICVRITHTASLG